MRIATVMISCAQREAARAETIAQLEAIGLEPFVFLSPCNPAGQIGNATVSRRALEYAALLNLPTLFVEDDIDLAPDFSWFLQRADPDRVTFLFMAELTKGRMPNRAISLYGPDIADAAFSGRPMPRQFVQARHWNGLWGTQCLLIPPKVVKDLAEDLREPYTAFDEHLRAYLERTRHPVMIALPNPVQHRGVRIARNGAGSGYRSFTYHSERLESG